MNKNLAMEILGFEKNSEFTQNELKSAYRLLARQYHPDYNRENEEVASEKMKAVNAAYDFLDKGKYYSDAEKIDQEQATAESLLKCKKDFIRGLNEYIKYPEDNYPKYFYSVLEEIKLIIINGRNSIYAAQSEEVVRNKVRSTVEQINAKFLELKGLFCSENNINIDKLDENNSMNYRYSIGDFYAQLVKLKDKYTLDNRIIEVVQSYQFDADYDKLKPYIDACVTIAKEKSKEAEDSTRMEEIIAEMQNKINIFFKRHKEIKKRMGAIQKWFEENEDLLSDEAMFYYNRFKLIESSYSDVMFDCNPEQQLDEFEDHFRDIKFRVDLGKDATFQIYSQALIQKFSSKLYSLNLIKSDPSFNNANEIMKRVKEVLEKITANINLDELYEFLDAIDFDNYEDSMNVIDEFEQKINYKIYIMKPDKVGYSLEQICFFVPKGKTKLYRIHPQSKNVAELDLNEVDLDNYISLDEVLENAKYIGKKNIIIDNRQINPITFLYQAGNILLYLESDGNICLKTNYPFNVDDSMPVNIPSEYQDKEKIKEMLKEQLSSAIQKENQDKFNKVAV